MTSTSAHIQPKVVVSDASFHGWLFPCRKSKISMGLFHKHWWLRYTIGHIQSKRSPSFDDQRILQSISKRDNTSRAQRRMVASDASFPWWLNPNKKLRNHLIQRYWWSENISIRIDTRHNWPKPNQKWQFHMLPYPDD